MSKPALSCAETMEAADAFLHEEWRELRNGAGAEELQHFSGMLRALNAVAILSNDQRELWGRRHMACPGHDDEGGRDWCAFCGEMPRDTDGFPVLTITAPDCDATCVSCQAGDHDECGVGCHADELAACYVQKEDPAAVAAWSQRQQQAELAGHLHLGRDDVLRCGVCAETLGAAAEYTTDRTTNDRPGASRRRRSVDSARQCLSQTRPRSPTRSRPTTGVGT